METTTTTETAGLHRFESAGLGKSPFRVVGFSVEKYQACQGAPIQCGASCDYCGEAIMNVFRIRGADGRTFKVGCDCVAKTGDAGLRKVVDAKVAKLRRIARHASESRKLTDGRAWLDSAEVQAFLVATPHPVAWRAERGDRMTAYLEFMWRASGTAGKLRALKTVREAMASVVVTTTTQEVV